MKKKLALIVSAIALAISLSDCNKHIKSIKMDGPNMDYVFHEGMLVMTSDKFSEEPEQRVTIPVSCILKVTEYND